MFLWLLDLSKSSLAAAKDFAATTAAIAVLSIVLQHYTWAQRCGEPVPAKAALLKQAGFPFAVRSGNIKCCGRNEVGWVNLEIAWGIIGIILRCVCVIVSGAVSAACWCSLQPRGAAGVGFWQPCSRAVCSGADSAGPAGLPLSLPILTAAYCSL